MGKRHKLGVQGHKSPQWQGWGYLGVLSAQSSALTGPHPCVATCHPSLVTHHISAGHSWIQTEVCVFKVGLFQRKLYPKNVFPHPKWPIPFLNIPSLHLAVKKGEEHKITNLPKNLSHLLMQAGKVKKWDVRHKVLPLGEDARLSPHHRAFLLSTRQEQGAHLQWAEQVLDPLSTGWELCRGQANPSLGSGPVSPQPDGKESKASEAATLLRHTGGRMRAPRRGW